MKMSLEWLQEHKLRETKLGWTDGPRWRLVKELTKPEVKNAKSS